MGDPFSRDRRGEKRLRFITSMGGRDEGEMTKYSTRSPKGFNLFYSHDRDQRPLTELGRDDLHEGPQGITPSHLPVIGADDGDDGLELISRSHDGLGMLATSASARNAQAHMKKISVEISSLGSKD